MPAASEGPARPSGRSPGRGQCPIGGRYFRSCGQGFPVRPRGSFSGLWDRSADSRRCRQAKRCAFLRGRLWGGERAGHCRYARCPCQRWFPMHANAEPTGCGLRRTHGGCLFNVGRARWAWREIPGSQRCRTDPFAGGCLISIFPSRLRGAAAPAHPHQHRPSQRAPRRARGKAGLSTGQPACRPRRRSVSGPGAQRTETFRASRGPDGREAGPGRPGRVTGRLSPNLRQREGKHGPVRIGPSMPVPGRRRSPPLGPRRAGDRHPSPPNRKSSR